ncbi:MAG: lyase family protein [Candidatus Nanoarchaeia archaeon]|nr:lyase family protein [Candidatus Nanoarchaeia archaeon]MDD5741746.1 lyase family protein [Candidatus Nanoarchaeia archaeon]
MDEDLDLVSKLGAEEKAVAEFRLKSISPDDGKYGKSADRLRDYLSAEAEWRECVKIQSFLLEVRTSYGKVRPEQACEVINSSKKISPLNMSLLEEKVTKHDQLAVIEEIGRYVKPETKALLHPGTTSYDILDTARSSLLKRAWCEVVRPEISNSIEQLCNLAERSMNILQVGRTHLQDTSPVPFGATLAGYAARIANRTELCDKYFNALKGKISGIVGTGASIEMVIGKDKALDFEKKVLALLNLKPDYTATQIVQKEAWADVGHGLTTLMHVLADFTNDIRMLYSSAIGEVTSRDNAERLGGSSADATKNNPIQYENITGKVAVVESGMRILYEMIHSDFQRDGRDMVQGRYQPQSMMTQVFESFSRLNTSLPQLSINEDIISKNLESIRRNPSEAMVAILRGESWIHSKYGIGHDFVKEIGKKAKKESRGLTEVALEDQEFKLLYDKLPVYKREILNGKLENYIGCSVEKAIKNIDYAQTIARGKQQNG